MITKVRQFVGKQSLTYARKRLKTSAKRFFFGIEPIACWHGIFRMFIVRSSFLLLVHTPYLESINEKSFDPNNPLPSFAIYVPLKCVVCFILLHD